VTRSAHVSLHAPEAHPLVFPRALHDVLLIAGNSLLLPQSRSILRAAAISKCSAISPPTCRSTTLIMPLADSWAEISPISAAHSNFSSWKSECANDHS
jgi:hypothetical protein